MNRLEEEEFRGSVIGVVSSSDETGFSKAGLRLASTVTAFKDCQLPLSLLEMLPHDRHTPRLLTGFVATVD